VGGRAGQIMTRVRKDKKRKGKGIDIHPMCGYSSPLNFSAVAAPVKTHTQRHNNLLLVYNVGI